MDRRNWTEAVGYPGRVLAAARLQAMREGNWRNPPRPGEEIGGAAVV